MKIKVNISQSKSGYAADFQHVAHILNTRDVATFVDIETFKSIWLDKKVKTLLELGDSKTNRQDTEETRQRRHEQEMRLFGTRDILYGAMINQKSFGFNRILDGYGNIAIVWSDRIKEKSTAFLGDSTVHKHVTGVPLLPLNHVTASAAQHWLAQYKIYPDMPMSYVEQDTGTQISKINLSKFDVDYEGLKYSIGGKYYHVEVQHKGPLIFPYDMKAIICKNIDYIEPIKKAFRSANVNLPVFAQSDYE